MKNLTDDQILAILDKTNTPVMLTSARAPWMEQFFLNFGRALLKEAGASYATMTPSQPLTLANEET